MANINYVKENNLTKLAREKSNSALYYFFILMVLAICFMYIDFDASIIFSIVAFTLLLLSISEDGRKNILLSGAEGELKSLNVLKDLSDEYTVFNQIQIPNQSSSTGFNESDFIIIGPRCVFIIEVKHNRGLVEGAYQDKEWRVTKNSQSGEEYTNAIKNPINQVNRCVWLLSEQLKLINAKAWIQGIVLFSHEHSDIRMKDSGKIPVLQMNELLDYIQNYQSKSAIINKGLLNNKLIQLNENAVY